MCVIVKYIKMATSSSKSTQDTYTIVGDEDGPHGIELHILAPGGVRVPMMRLCPKILPFCRFQLYTISVVGMTNDTCDEYDSEPSYNDSDTRTWLTKAMEVDADIINQNSKGSRRTTKFIIAPVSTHTVIQINLDLSDGIYVFNPYVEKIYETIYETLPTLRNKQRLAEQELLKNQEQSETCQIPFNSFFPSGTPSLSYNYSDSLSDNYPSQLAMCYRIEHDTILKKIRHIRDMIIRTTSLSDVRTHLETELDEAKLACLHDDSQHLLDRIRNDMVIIDHHIESFTRTLLAVIQRTLGMTITKADIDGAYMHVPYFMMPYLMLPYEMPTSHCFVTFKFGTARVTYLINLERVMRNKWNASLASYHEDDDFVDDDYVAYPGEDDYIYMIKHKKQTKHTKSHTSFRVRGHAAVIVQGHQAIGCSPRIIIPKEMTKDAIPRDRIKWMKHKKSNPRCLKPKEVARRMNTKTHF